MFSVVVLISGRGSNLRAIIDATNDASTYTLSAVVASRETAPGLNRARDANIPTHCVDRKSYPNSDDFNAALLEKVSALNPQLVVLAGFMHILSAAFVNHFSGRLINIHPSLLPKFRGLNTHQRALDANESKHGASVHFVTEELDGGPVIAQVEIEVRPEDDVHTLAQRVLCQEHVIYPELINRIASGTVALSEQGIVIDGQLISKPLQWNAATQPTSALS